MRGPPTSSALQSAHIQIKWAKPAGLPSWILMSALHGNQRFLRIGTFPDSSVYTYNEYPGKGLRGSLHALLLALHTCSRELPSPIFVSWILCQASALACISCKFLIAADCCASSASPFGHFHDFPEESNLAYLISTLCGASQDYHKCPECLPRDILESGLENCVY